MALLSCLNLGSGDIAGFFVMISSSTIPIGGKNLDYSFLNFKTKTETKVGKFEAKEEVKVGNPGQVF